MKTRQCALLATFIAIIWAFGIVNLKADPFQVQTFKAWEAYNTSNGLWRVADFSGDGKTDLINLNQAGNTTYLWTSKGNGSFTITSFQAWKGYNFDGVWKTGDFNNDGFADLFHAVEGQSFVRIWQSNGDGTFKIFSYQPWKNYPIPAGEWLTGDFNGDGKTDIAHVVKNTDYVNIWLSKGKGLFSVNIFSTLERIFNA